MKNMQQVNFKKNIILLQGKQEKSVKQILAFFRFHLHSYTIVWLSSYLSNREISVSK